MPRFKRRGKAFLLAGAPFKMEVCFAIFSSKDWHLYRLKKSLNIILFIFTAFQKSWSKAFFGRSAVSNGGLPFHLFRKSDIIIGPKRFLNNFWPYNTQRLPVVECTVMIRFCISEFHVIVIQLSLIRFERFKISISVYSFRWIRLNFAWLI